MVGRSNTFIYFILSYFLPPGALQNTLIRINKNLKKFIGLKIIFITLHVAENVSMIMINKKYPKRLVP